MVDIRTKRFNESKEDSWEAFKKRLPIKLTPYHLFLQWWQRGSDESYTIIQDLEDMSLEMKDLGYDIDITGSDRNDGKCSIGILFENGDADIENFNEADYTAFLERIELYFKQKNYKTRARNSLSYTQAHGQRIIGRRIYFTKPDVEFSFSM